MGVVMTTIHRTTVVGQCPLGCADIYEVEFHVANKTIPVETIQAEIDKATQSPIYQEDLTSRLASALRCTVVTRGTHSRFRTECSASMEANG
jgi:hypothetical protein